MKLPLSSIFSTLLLVPFSEAVDDLQARWNIENVAATNDRNKFTFSYSGTSKSWLTNDNADNVVEKVQITMYDFDCKPTTASVNANEATYGQIGILDSTKNLETDEFVMDSLGYASGGSGTDLEFKFTTVPKNMAKNNKITGLTVNDKSDMKFCVRIGLIAVDDSDSTKNNEINFQETEVTLSVTMSGDFDITKFDVAPKEKTSDSASQTYKVIASLCEGSQQAPKVNEKFNQGAAIRVCIKPESKAKNDGVIMKSVDSFTWTRTYEPVGNETPPPTTQNAIIGTNIESLDGLTLLNKDDKTEFIVTSVLFAAFYATDGDVSATGAATMAFPSATAADAATAAAVAATVTANAATATAAADAAAAVVVWDVAGSGYVSEACQTLCSGTGKRGQQVSSAVTKTIVRDYLDNYGVDDSASDVYGDDINCWDISGVSKLNDAFRNTVYNNRLDCWDTSSVTEMQTMFFSASSFDFNIGMWDVSRVTDMKKMFGYARTFDQDIGMWDVSRVEDFYQMFTSDNSVFDQDISSWDTSNGDDFREMFKGATAFDKDLSSWVTSNAGENQMTYEYGVDGRNLQEGGSSENDAIVAPFEMTASVNKADDGPAALQQTAGGTGNSITVVATTIVGLVSAILLA